jgi:hypothetical protein
MGQLNNFLSQVSMSNLQQEAALRDPNNLQYDPTALLETE